MVLYEQLSHVEHGPLAASLLHAPQPDECLAEHHLVAPAAPYLGIGRFEVEHGRQVGVGNVGIFEEEGRLLRARAREAEEVV